MLCFFVWFLVFCRAALGFFPRNLSRAQLVRGNFFNVCNVARCVKSGNKLWDTKPRKRVKRWNGGGTRWGKWKPEGGGLVGMCDGEIRGSMVAELPSAQNL